MIYLAGVKMSISEEQLMKMNQGLQGLYNLSPVATEPYFSACGCDACGSELAGDRYEIIGIRGKKHTDPKEVLLVCVDCYLYLFT